jgi:hypothetical protein
MGFLDDIFGKKGEVKTYHSRDGTPTKLDDLLVEIYKTKKRIDVHFSYLNLVGQTYNARIDPEARALFKRLAMEHIDMFSKLRAPLLKLGGGTFPHVPTFEYLATVYTEDGEYEKAIEVCEKAIAFGLHDWTKSDYAGRIERIKKKAQKGNR